MLPCRTGFTAPTSSSHRVSHNFTSITPTRTILHGHPCHWVVSVPLPHTLYIVVIGALITHFPPLPQPHALYIYCTLLIILSQHRNYMDTTEGRTASGTVDERRTGRTLNRRRRVAKLSVIFGWPKLTETETHHQPTSQSVSHTARMFARLNHCSSVQFEC